MLIKNWYYLFDSLNGYFIQLLLNIDVLYIIVDNIMCIHFIVLLEAYL